MHVQCSCLGIISAHVHFTVVPSPFGTSSDGAAAVPYNDKPWHQLPFPHKGLPEDHQAQSGREIAVSPKERFAFDASGE